jgi:AraC-like DNA-binding protein
MREPTRRNTAPRRRLPETTYLTVTEVARQARFEDDSVFRRHFTGQVGLSPIAYRRAFGQPNGGRPASTVPHHGPNPDPQTKT